MKLSPGEKAMLVGTAGFGAHLWVKPVTVSAIWKSGIIVLDGIEQKYRSDGNPTGKRDGYTSPAKLRPWDDRVWQDFQRGEINRAQASKLFKLGEALQRASRYSEEAAKIWEAVPFEIQQMVKEEGE
jgi:hypothetical protein